MKINVESRVGIGVQPSPHDACFVIEDGRAMAIFDGFGPDGDSVARESSEFFLDTWERYSALDRAEQFIDCDREIGAHRSGTSATVAEVVSYPGAEDLIYVHSVGNTLAYKSYDEDMIRMFDQLEHEADSARMQLPRSIGNRACRYTTARPSKYVEQLRDGQLIVVASEGMFPKENRDRILSRLALLNLEKNPLNDIMSETLDITDPVMDENGKIILARYLA